MTTPPKSAAALCRERGWGAGDLYAMYLAPRAGDQSWVIVVHCITAVGRAEVLSSCIGALGGTGATYYDGDREVTENQMARMLPLVDETIPQTPEFAAFLTACRERAAKLLGDSNP